jgi:hypothetical protein
MEGMPRGPLDAHRLVQGGPGDTDEASRRSQRLQILATEHWNLLATRSLSWNESFSRAGMFLTVLSGAVVSLALVAQATEFGSGFAVFALLVLPVVLFIGGATFVRLVEVNNEDLRWVYGMNRLRHAYIEMEPDLEPYFISGWTDDPTGIHQTYGIVEEGSGFFHGFITTPATCGFVNAMVAAVLAGIALLEVARNSMGAPVILTGAAVFIAALVVQWVFQARSAARYAARLEELFATVRRDAEHEPEPTGL